MSDKQLILELIKPFVERGVLLDRKTINLNEFVLIKKEDELVACAGLKNYEEGMAEIYCFAVATKYQNIGLGTQLLKLLKEKAKNNKLFAISKFGGKWFLKQGFVLGDIKDLPKSKQDSYDTKRNSSVYIKE